MDTNEMSAVVREYADEVYEEELALLRELAQIPAPSGHEERRAAFVRDWLLDQGMPADLVHIDEANNVVLDLSGGARELAVFSAHTDVVFPDEDALPLCEDTERMYAPGVGDDTANLVGLLFAARWLWRNAPQLAGGAGQSGRGVLVVANSCEEGLGNLAGTRALFDAYGARIKVFTSFDLYLGGHVTRAVGSERWRATLRTQGGHSWEDAGAASAIEQLCGLVQDFYALPLPTADKTARNVGLIEGGTSVNAIASGASALLEYRSANADCLARMREGLWGLVEARRARGEKVSLELLGKRPASTATEPVGQAELVAAGDDAIRRVTGQTPPHQESSTDANIPLSLGVPGHTLGAVRGGLLHTRDEWIEKASLKQGLELVLTLMLNA